jgi:hypothetical protein
MALKLIFDYWCTIKKTEIAKIHSKQKFFIRHQALPGFDFGKSVN